MSLAYLHYDVFTREPLLGNQLAVFTDARGVDTDLMQRLALEMNFAESTFILPAERRDTDVRMRIFTPRVEMPMAGHPTIGSTFALAEVGIIRPGSSRLVFGLNIGPVPVDLEWAGEQLRFAWMTQPNPQFGPVVHERSAVASALGLGVEALATDLPIQQISCGVPVLLTPLRDHDAVDRAISDAAAFRRLRAYTGLEMPVYLFALSPVGSSQTVYSRMFAPEFGITEDPATGSACGPLGCYLVEHGLVSGDAAQRIVSLQGVAMGRASRIHVAIDGAVGAITRVRVGGEAVLVARGELLLEPAVVRT
jgi:trans-2,3-dihydro-3-hydroxyanthranilate isomerase